MLCRVTRRVATVLAVAALAVLPLAGCAPSTQTVHGSIAVTDYANDVHPEGGSQFGIQGTGDACTPGAGFGDVKAGAEVDIVDGSGKVLAAGQLGAGAVPRTLDSCTFEFTVVDVPQGETLYGVKVGTASRGVVHFKSDAMFGDGPRLTLG